MLTENDYRLIASLCQSQNATSIAEFTAFARAYTVAKIAAESCESVLSKPGTIISLLTLIGSLVNADSRDSDFEFPNILYLGNQKLRNSILDPLHNWAEALSSFRSTPFEAYKELRGIHNCFDSRIGHLVWAIAVTRVEGFWPETLPPNLFGREPILITSRNGRQKEDEPPSE